MHCVCLAFWIGAMNRIYSCLRTFHLAYKAISIENKSAFLKNTQPV